MQRSVSIAAALRLRLIGLLKRPTRSGCGACKETFEWSGWPTRSFSDSPIPAWHQRLLLQVLRRHRRLTTPTLDRKRPRCLGFVAGGDLVWRGLAVPLVLCFRDCKLNCASMQSQSAHACARLQLHLSMWAWLGWRDKIVLKHLRHVSLGQPQSKSKAFPFDMCCNQAAHCGMLSITYL